MRTVMTTALSMFVTMAVLGTSDADAYSTFRAHTASACMALNTQTIGDYFYWSGNVSGGGSSLQNRSSTTNMEAICPIISDSTVNATSSSAVLTLYGYSNASGSVSALACVMYYPGGGQCSAMSSVTEVGTTFASTITAPAAWSGRYASDGYYMAVDLGNSSPGNGYTSIWSYSLEN
jgi:hypothetical protein